MSNERNTLDIDTLDTLASMIGKNEFHDCDEQTRNFLLNLHNIIGKTNTVTGHPDPLKLVASWIFQAVDNPELHKLFSENKISAGILMESLNIIVFERKINVDFRMSPFVIFFPEARKPGKSDQYIMEGKLGAAEGGEFSHEVGKVKKRPSGTTISEKHKALWFKKYEPDQILAIREVAAQEMFRAFIPNHPKTRLVIDVANDSHKTYVLSKGVEGYTTLDDIAPKRLNLRLKVGTYKGMGEVMVMAMFMNEIDLKPGNMGIDKNGKVIKIDGDWCFSKLRVNAYENENYDITSEVINGLPFHGKYYAYNWLDQMQAGKANNNPSIIDFGNENFRKEVNSTLLKIILMPDHLIHNLVGHQHQSLNNQDIINETNQMISLVLERKEQMIHAALANNSFQQFMQTPETVKVKNEFLKSLVDFKMTSKNYLVSQSGVDLSTVEDQIESRFDKTLSLVNPGAQQKPAQALSSEDFLKILDEFYQSKKLFSSSISPEIKNIIKDLKSAATDEERFQMADKYIKMHPNQHFSLLLNKAMNATKAVMQDENINQDIITSRPTNK